MIMRKSMISAVTAAVLVAGFTGCSSDTTNLTEPSQSTSNTTSTSTSTNASAVVNQNEQAKYTAPIQGLVIDDRGQFIVGATVTIGGQTTTTNAGGQYAFENVDISNYAINEMGEDILQEGDDNCLMVSIQAPAGTNMNNVVVEVSPKMIHVADANDNDYGDGFSEVTVSGDQNVVANSQSFVINSQVGTAMLVHKAAKIKFDLRNEATGVAIADGTKVIAMYLGNTSTEGNADITINDNAITSVNSVFAYTNNGEVIFNNLLTSSDYDFIVEGYVSDIETATKTYAGDEYMMDLGNQVATLITSVDDIAPQVATVKNQFGMDNMTNRLMLQSSVKKTIEIVFTEAMQAENISDNVKVVSGDNFLEIENVTLDGNQLTVTLLNDLEDGQEFDILVFRDTNLADMAGNPLVFVGANAADEGNENTNLIELNTCNDGCNDADREYLSCTVGSRAIKFELEAYKELLMDAVAPSAIAQMQLDTDTNRTDASVLSDLEEYSNAFNNIAPGELNDAGWTIDLSGVTLQFNNVSGNETAGRLTALKNELGEAGFVKTDGARIKFTAGKAAAYEITVPRGLACAAGNENLKYKITEGTCLIDNRDTEEFLVAGFSEGDVIEMIITGDGISSLEHGDKVVITPVNDLCMAGTAATETLLDNVAPTTVLQNSYIGGEVADGVNQIVPFGEGGELTNPHAVDAGLGVPALYITPGLLDNLNANGNNILGVNNFVSGDESLLHELYIHNYADNNYSNPVEGLRQAVYDATGYEEFAKNLSRSIGVAFSENVDLTDATPSFAGSSVSGYKAVNDIGRDDAGHEVSRDLVSFETSNVMTLANEESNAIMSFDGIKDEAGNAAGNGHANVKVLDGMPPMVTKALFDGENVIITFNEAVKLETFDAATPKGSLLMVEGARATYDVTDSVDAWTLDATKTILTVAASEFPGLNASTFSENHEYDESSEYGLTAGDYKHAKLFTAFIADEKDNSWFSWMVKDRDFALDTGNNDDSVINYADIDELPKFAMISSIGEFEIKPDDSGFVADNTGAAQKITFTFNHAIVTGAGELFNANGVTLDEDTAADKTTIDEWFEYVLADTEDGISLTDFVTDVKISLNSTGKVITITFKSPQAIFEDDVVRTVGTKVFTSSVDDKQAKPANGSANGN